MPSLTRALIAFCVGCVIVGAMVGAVLVWGLM